MDHKDIRDTIVRGELEGDTAVLPKITEEMLREAAEQTRRIELAETQPQSEAMADTRRIDTSSDTKPFSPVQEQEQPDLWPQSVQLKADAEPLFWKKCRVLAARS